MKRSAFFTLALAGTTVRARADDLATPVPVKTPRAKGNGAIKRGETFPNLTIEGRNGRSVDIPNDDGKAIWLAFFASWCPPCRLEIPALVDVAVKHADALTVVGVDVFEEPYRAEAFIRAEKIPFVVATLGSRNTGAFRGISIPAGILIDKSGVVQDIWIGTADDDKHPLGDHLQNVGIVD